MISVDISAPEGAHEFPGSEEEDEEVECEEKRRRRVGFRCIP